MESIALRILIIDDSELAHLLLNVILRADDYTIVGAAYDAATGIRLAQELCPDVILLDIMMPDVSGLRALGTLRAMLPTVLILMVSGIDDNAVVNRAIELGASGYIIKPFNTLSIIETMSAIKDKFVLAKAVPDQT